MNKETLFAKLKQAYAALGLGDAYLQSLAESLAAMGTVTDENADAVVAAQKALLETAQKANDKRAQDAVKAAEDKAKKAAEDAAKAAQKAQEEAIAKALKDAEDKRKADEAAAKAAAEKAEAERRAKEELEKSKNIPDWYKAELAKAEEARRAALEERRAEQEAAKKEAEERNALIKQLQESNKKLAEGLKELTDENSRMKATRAQAERQKHITERAKELGIPDYRIEEGFNIADDADDAGIDAVLSKVAGNIKANQLPQQNRFPLGEGKVSDEAVKGIAAKLVR